jgi:hypothetical protein
MSKNKQLEGRDEEGKFVAGRSGNPRGRPRGGKNRITQLKQNLEIAVREAISTQDIVDVMKAMVEEAKNGSVTAQKAVLEHFVSKAKEGEDIEAAQAGIKIIVQNATFKAENSSSDDDFPQPLEGECTPIEE